MNPAGYAVGLSEHPDAGVAVGEVCGAVLDGVGSAPDVAVLFVSGTHLGAVRDIVDAVHATVAPRHLVGATASTVIGGHREAEGGPAVALWARAEASGVASGQLEVVHGPEGPAIVGLGPELTGDGTLVVMADPFSFPVDALLRILHDVAPELTVVGGVASAAAAPGGNRLVAGRHVVDAGAVVLRFPAVAGSGGPASGAPAVRAVVSQGCRPVGSPYIVTDGADNQIAGLGGRPPVERLRELVASAEPDDEARLRAGIHIGKVIDEGKVEFGPGDFLVRGIIGIDQATGSMAVGDRVAVGETVQFHVRDAATATAELATLAATPATAGLLFTCNGRGTHLFGEADHDANVVQEAAGPLVLAGMACAGELGPIGGQNFLHSYTACLTLFD